MDVTAATPEWWSIDAKEITVGPQLGEGSYGVVYRAKWRDQDVALKQLKKVNKNQVKEFKREADLMVSLRPHINVVKCFGVCLDPLGIVTEFLEMGSVKDLLQKTKINFIQIIGICKDVVKGMKHLHIDGVIHRDLSCRNILVTEGKKGKWICKVADFGLSREVFDTTSGKGKTDSETGPLKWMAPESLLNKTYSVKSDIWSFGCTVIELLTEGKDPYPTLDPIQAASLVMHRDVKPSPPEDCPASLAQLLEMIFQRNPEVRPDFQHVLTVIDDIEKDITSNPFYLQ